ncbi:DUF2341 domain-containing protein, partial [Planctomycetota bacterium]
MRDIVLNTWKITAAVLFMAALVFCPISDTSGAWYPVATWKYRIKITLNAAQVPNTDQNNFPVLINKTFNVWKDTANGGHAGQADGGDFLFTAADGSTKLSHEIEKYDNTTGELVAWVKVPVVSASTDTVIYI